MMAEIPAITEEEEKGRRTDQFKMFLRRRKMSKTDWQR